MNIPVCTPLFKGNEKKYLCEAISTGWVSSDGYFVRKFEEAFAEWSGNRYAVTVCNGTAALETALWAANIVHTNIRIPNATIISCALAALRLHNTLFLYDSIVSSDIPLMRCHLFGTFNNSKTKDILIDDASQYWKPFKVKDVACYSLYANKTITCGEGGVLVTNNKSIYTRAKSYRNLCHSKERFIHDEIGFNYRMSNLQAAVALAQLEQIDRFIEIKQRNRDLYKKYMPDKAKILFDVQIPWMYLIETKIDAGYMVKALQKQGIECRRYFYPLNRQPCLSKIFTPRDYSLYVFPVSEYKWQHLFYLPSGLTLTERQVKYICDSLKNILNTTTKSTKINPIN